MNSILIDQETLRTWQGDPKLRLFDVRYNLSDADEGRVLYEHSHIAGAQYLDLEKHLAGPHIAGVTGRHPLPDSGAFIACLRRAGVSNDSRLVVYDDGSHFFAPRVWWMLSQWLGYDNIFILHGGLRSWQAQGLPVSDEVVSVEPGSFSATENSDVLITAEEIPAFIEDGGVIFDARDLERYRGDFEPIDGKAGHIPGALCRPFVQTMDAQSDFLSPQALREFFAVAEGRQCAYYCGSGVTGCVGILALMLAGLPLARLYSGSWSEWITEPGRLVAIGEEIG